MNSVIRLSDRPDRTVFVTVDRGRNAKSHRHQTVRNPGMDIFFPIFIRKEIETRKLC